MPFGMAVFDPSFQDLRQIKVVSSEVEMNGTDGAVTTFEITA